MPHRLLASVALLFICCAAKAQTPAPPVIPASPAISYVKDIQPILTEKCVACHACNDAPCQLNLGSGEGVSRGASKVPVYQ
ncbi:peptidylprolyl isomerase, partial [Pseudomonas syringae]